MCSLFLPFLSSSSFLPSLVSTPFLLPPYFSSLSSFLSPYYFLSFLSLPPLFFLFFLLFLSSFLASSPLLSFTSSNVSSALFVFSFSSLSSSSSPVFPLLLSFFLHPSPSLHFLVPCFLPFLLVSCLSFSLLSLFSLHPSCPLFISSPLSFLSLPPLFFFHKHLTRAACKRSLKNKLCLFFKLFIIVFTCLKMSHFQSKSNQVLLISLSVPVSDI